MSSIRRSHPSYFKMAGLVLTLVVGIPIIVFGFPEMSRSSSQAGFVLESFGGCFALASAVMCWLG